MMNLARFQPVVLGLLYHISIEDKFKSLFTYTECIPRIYEMLMRVQVMRRVNETGTIYEMLMSVQVVKRC